MSLDQVWLNVKEIALLCIFLSSCYWLIWKAPTSVEGGSNLNNYCFSGHLPIVLNNVTGVPEGGNGEGEPTLTLPSSYESCAGFPDFNGDGYADLAIGAPDENIGSVLTFSDAGAVHVIYGKTTGLEAVSASALLDDQVFDRTVEGLNSLTMGEGDSFGQALAYGDFNQDGFDDLAIGVPGSLVDGLDAAGAVHVIYGSRHGLTPEDAQDWTQESTAVDSTAEEDDQFGFSLVGGDFDGDGFDDLAIGTPNENIGGALDAGSVNIIFGTSLGLRTTVNLAQGVGKNDEWVTQDLLSGNSSESNDQFGYSLTKGDFNQDGFDDLVVGVPFEDNFLLGLGNAGVVNIFYGSSEGVIQSGNNASTQEIYANSDGVDNLIEENDQFGFSLAAADFDGNGFDDLAIGVPYESHGTGGSLIQNAGAVNIVFSSVDGSGLDPSTGAPILHQGLTGVQSDPSAFEFFGWDLVAADFNNDGFVDLGVGVPFDQILGVQIGSTHIFYSDVSGPATVGDEQIFDPDNPEVNDGFGFAVTAVDANGDSYIDLVVGSNNDDPINIPNDNTGSVFIFYSDSSGVSLVSNENFYQGYNGVAGASETNDRFGAVLP
ncbi:MAG: hypothetical protein AAF490_16945 [Chloroflexota bacterium]